MKAQRVSGILPADPTEQHARAGAPHSNRWLQPVISAAMLSFCMKARAAEDAIPTLRPPQAEIPPTFWEQYGLLVVLCGAALFALTALAVWFASRPKALVVVPPEVRARRELESLRQLPESGLVLSRVSQILRRYVATVFELSPGELTTAEFCREIAGDERMGPDLSAVLAEFLRGCDERKFAPNASPSEIGAGARALAIIDLAESRRAQLHQAAAGPASPQPAHRA